jgi:FolB domain-containing protein
MSIDVLKIEGLRQPVRLGCTDQERAYTQLVNIDVEVTLDTEKCISTDELKDTVDYLDIAAAIERVSKETEWKLLERMCDTLAHEVLSAFRSIRSVKLQARKFIIPNSSGISCTVVRERE